MFDRDSRACRCKSLFAMYLGITFTCCNAVPVTASSQSLVCDALNRLKEHVSGPLAESYVYSDGEKRIKKSSDGEATYYMGAHYEEQWEQGTRTASTVHYTLPGRKVATRSDQGLHYTYGDQVNSATRFANQRGKQTSALWYTPFGGEIARTGELDARYTYTGKERDDTGLQYYGARYTDGEIGRFMSADTLLPDVYSAQLLNRFAYVINNPVRLTDPTGHAPMDPGVRDVFGERYDDMIHQPTGIPHWMWNDPWFQFIYGGYRGFADFVMSATADSTFDTEKPSDQGEDVYEDAPVTYEEAVEAEQAMLALIEKIKKKQLKGPLRMTESYVLDKGYQVNNLVRVLKNPITYEIYLKIAEQGSATKDELRQSLKLTDKALRGPLLKLTGNSLVAYETRGPGTYRLNRNTQNHFKVVIGEIYRVGEEIEEDE